MKKEFTSASAYKQIRALEEEKAHVLEQERMSSTYVLAVDEEGEPPEYDYFAVREQVADLDRKVRTLRCAMHAFNVRTVLPESGVSIDEALVLMAQLNEEKRRLGMLRSNMPKQRLGDMRYRMSKVVEYQYANYDVERAEADFQEVSERIRALQMEIDYANQTITFEVEL